MIETMKQVNGVESVGRLSVFFQLVTSEMLLVEYFKNGS